MGEEIQGGERERGWRKAIPEARDRLQSKWLVGVVGALLVWGRRLSLCGRFTCCGERFFLRRLSESALLLHVLCWRCVLPRWEEHSSAE